MSARVPQIVPASDGSDATQRLRCALEDFKTGRSDVITTSSGTTDVTNV